MVEEPEPATVSRWSSLERRAGTIATSSRRARRRRAALRTPSGFGSEGSCSGSAASYGASSALAQLHQLVVKLVNRMDVVEERLDNVPKRMDLHIQQCQTVFDDAVALVSNTLDVVAALPDSQEARLDEGALRSAGWAPTGLQSVFPTFPAFPIPDGVKMVAEAAAIAAPKPGSVRAAVRRHEARTQLLAAGPTRCSGNGLKFAGVDCTGAACPANRACTQLGLLIPIVLDLKAVLCHVRVVMMSLPITYARVSMLPVMYVKLSSLLNVS